MMERLLLGRHTGQHGGGHHLGWGVQERGRKTFRNPGPVRVTDTPLLGVPGVQAPLPLLSFCSHLTLSICVNLRGAARSPDGGVRYIPNAWTPSCGTPKLKASLIFAASASKPGEQWDAVERGQWAPDVHVYFQPNAWHVTLENSPACHFATAHRFVPARAPVPPLGPLCLCKGPLEGPCACARDRFESLSCYFVRVVDRCDTGAQLCALQNLKNDLGDALHKHQWRMHEDNLSVHDTEPGQ